MSSFWNRFVHRVITRTITSTGAVPDAGTVSGPPVPPAPAAFDRVALPPTYWSAAPDDGARRPRLFDPALRQFGSAFRPGDPEFADAEAARRWLALRRSVTDHVLRRIAGSPFGESLVLRGSRLMKAWLGDRAREPGDLDWVVAPASMRMSDPRAVELFRRLTQSVLAEPGPVGVELVADGVAIDDIWTYERAPGRRVVFPWRAPGLPGGSVQVDVVFGEPLVEPARWESVAAADGGCVTVRAAGPAQSLAWKLLWLATDSNAQGKDLFDAVLLAERFPPPAAVLEPILLRGDYPLSPTASGFVGALDVDWGTFRLEYPWVVGDEAPWLARLEQALGPTFTGRGEAAGGLDEPGDPAEAREGRPEPAWLTPTALGLARGIADDRDWDRLPILADALEEAGCDRDDLLDHCRARGPHTVGCWALDRILGEHRS